MTKIKAVVFDMDGVLFDTESISIKVWKQIGEEMGVENIDLAVYGCVGMNRADIVRFFYQHYGEDFPVEKYLQMASERCNRVIVQDGLPIMKGAQELLAHLKKENYLIGLASSTRKSRVLQHLQESGLTEYFSVVIGGDMVEYSKPEPDIYLKACQELGVEPEEAIAIEDSPNGIRSAHAAGMYTVMVPDMIAPTPEIEALYWRCCDNLLEVKELLQQL